MGERVALLAAMSRLGELESIGQLPATLRDELRAELETRKDGLQEAIQRLLAAHPELARSRRDDTVRALLIAERTALEGAAARGLISTETMETLQREIDARLEQPSTVAFVATPGVPPMSGEPVAPPEEPPGPS